MGSTFTTDYGAVVTATDTLEVMCCGECGVLYALPAALLKERKRDSESFYCPNGHSRHFPKGGTAEARLKRELEQERARAGRIAAQRDQERARAQHAEDSARAYKGVATKARKRAKEGVCPCCNRTFKQLAAHMKNKHPDFEPEPVDA